jgi:hypothetical protein
MPDPTGPYHHPARMWIVIPIWVAVQLVYEPHAHLLLASNAVPLLAQIALDVAWFVREPHTVHAKSLAH